MKELYLSNYSLDILNDESLNLTNYKEIDISNYGLEIVSKELLALTLKKSFFVSNMSIEILHPYSDTIVESFSYYFQGQVLENSTFINRDIFSYNQNTLLLLTSTTSDNGNFLLKHLDNDIYFLICKDDSTGLSYNHLIIASMVPDIINTYGMAENNPGLSAYDIKLKNPAATYSGLYWIKPSGYSQAIQIFCDMSTQGGGWTLCLRWDRDFPAGSRYLPLNVLRSNIDIANLVYTNAICSSQCSSINIIPLISAGAKMFMHIGIDIYDTVWKHVYFSEIYQAVIDNPSNIFDPTFDTNTSSRAGTIVRSSYLLRNRWFDYDMTSTPPPNTDFDYVYDYYLDAGPGQAMFTVNSDTGAIYSSHQNSSCTEAYAPRVLWGFFGKDNSLPTNDRNSKHLVGTYGNSTSPPNCRFNLMFIR